jgi:ketosteroid isomerase-like protein
VSRAKRKERILTRIHSGNVDNAFSPVRHHLSTKEDLVMTTMDIGKEVAALCKQGKNQEAIDRFYAPNIESVEPVAMPGMGQTQTGIQTVKKKNQWWVDNHEIHGGTVDGPYPHGDRFILHFKYDVTPKHTGKRMALDETGLYTVRDGKVVKEEFFYSMDSGDCVAKA